MSRILRSGYGSDCGIGQWGAHATKLKFLLRGKRILLVEYSRENRALIKHRCHWIGVEIDHVEDGEAGYETVLDAWYRGEGYDIVIMNIGLPRQTALEVLE